MVVHRLLARTWTLTYMVALAFLACAGSVLAWDVQYSNFTSTSGLSLYNSASVVSNSSTGQLKWLRLCQDGTSTGANAQVWTQSKYNTVNGFVVEFQFKVVNSTGMAADGFSFAIHNAGATAAGWSYGPDSAVSLRFDTFLNGDEPSNSFMAVSASGLGDLARVDLQAIGFQITDSALHSVRIECGNGLMNVILDGTTRVSRLPVDINAAGAADGLGLSWVGFSAGTGGAAEDNYIASLKFQSGFQMPVETPTLSPDGGTYVSARNVTMSCVTPGAEIHYTTDGSTPTLASSLYTAIPVAMGTGTLKAIAYKAGWDFSMVKSASYTVEGCVISVGAAKSLPDNAHVAVSGIVSGAFADGLMFVEATDRSAGIAVMAASAPLFGSKRVVVDGTIKTTSCGERYIAANSVDSPGFGQILPVSMTIKTLGGQALGLQGGVGGGVGLNNIGLLATTWGMSNQSLENPSLSDGVGQCAIEPAWRTGVVIDPEYSFVKVTGGIRCTKADASSPVTRVIRPRYARDVAGTSTTTWDTTFGPDFAGNSSLIVRTGSAVYLTDANMDYSRRLRLASNSANAVGSAFFNTKVKTSPGFTTKFVFQISQPSGGFSKGFGFIVHNDSSGASASALPTGTGSNSVAVVFDTSQGTGEPSAHFIELRVGGPSGIPVRSVDLTPLGITLTDEYAHLAEITFKPDEGWLTLKIDGVTILLNTPVDFVAAGAIDALGKSWIGFAGQNDASTQCNDIVSWKFKGNPSTNAKYSLIDLSNSETWRGEAFDVNSVGSIVGQTGFYAPFSIGGWINDGSTAQSIASFGGTVSSAYSVGRAGQAVGEASNLSSV
ncbi:MAG: chitobiase/beta-hexosaminidase C-terminal domain-containing protein, partial [Armatimonadota bacterium]